MVDITDPIQGITWCNENIKRVKGLIDQAEKDGDVKTAMRGEYTLMKWTEQLQHYIRMKHQMGMETEDISRSAKKKRFVARD